MPKKDYKVGYGRPPEHTRFKKGQSGNPKGRPKGTRNFKTDLAEVLDERVLINEGGTRTEVSKQLAIIKRVTEKALNGDTKASQMIAQWVAQYIGLGEDDVDNDNLSLDDQTIIDRFLQSNLDTSPTGSTDDEHSEVNDNDQEYNDA